MAQYVEALCKKLYLEQLFIKYVHAGNAVTQDICNKFCIVLYFFANGTDAFAQETDSTWTNVHANAHFGG